MMLLSFYDLSGVLKLCLSDVVLCHSFSVLCVYVYSVLRLMPIYVIDLA